MTQEQRIQKMRDKLSAIKEGESDRKSAVYYPNLGCFITDKLSIIDRRGNVNKI